MKAEGEQSHWKYEKHECTESLFIAFQKYSSLFNWTTLVPFRPELDACDSPDKYPQLFHVILDIEIQSADRQTELTPPWENFTTKDINPSILFSSHQEHQDTLALAGKGCMDLFPSHDFFMLSWVLFHPTSLVLCAAGRGATDSPQDNIRNVGQSAFFSSLSWQGRQGLVFRAKSAPKNTNNSCSPGWSWSEAEGSHCSIRSQSWALPGVAMEWEFLSYSIKLCSVGPLLTQF